MKDVGFHAIDLTLADVSDYEELTKNRDAEWQAKVDATEREITKLRGIVAAAEISVSALKAKVDAARREGWEQGVRAMANNSASIKRGVPTAQLVLNLITQGPKS